MADLPLCRSCKKPYELVRETSDWYEMACPACEVGHVFSKPQAKEAARYLARLERRLHQEKMIREWERARKAYSFSPTRTPKEIT